MLARYHIVRGKRAPDDPLPDGKRVDVRKHTGHVLSPTPALVTRYLTDASEPGWRRFREAYVELLGRRYGTDPTPFEALARMASEGDVFIGCNCPTKKNPDVQRCHTVLALRFMRDRFRALDVRLP